MQPRAYKRRQQKKITARTIKQLFHNDAEFLVLEFARGGDLYDTLNADDVASVVSYDECRQYVRPVL